ncbi:MAG: hypothetical protein JWM31_2246, partial [Solirubrobacterales bacterium]|nr:hypothetical protein [Solirubrobacterales bacterium]
MGAIKRTASRAVEKADAFWWRPGLAVEAPALTYYLIISLVPVSLGLTVLGALFFGDYTEGQLATERAAKVLPPALRDQIVSLVGQAKRDSPVLIAFSIITMLWTCSGAVAVLERVLAAQLDWERPGPLAGKLRQVGLAGGVAGMLLAVVVGTQAASQLISRLNLPSAITWGGWVPAAVTVLAVALLLRLSGPRRLRWPAAFVGALVPAAALQALPWVIGVYVNGQARLTVATVFVTLAVLVFSCSILAHALILGCAVAARVHRRLGGPVGVALNAPRLAGAFP